MLRPIGSMPAGQNCRAAASLTSATGAPPASSRSVISRPFRRGMRKASIAPGVVATTSAKDG
jgi:hypothetical protein